ncbi:hypothetical protein LQZ18_03215 [Lachnospiraceae bacterium ZAX-1]
MGAHSKTFLLDSISEGRHLSPAAEKIYYFSNGEVYILNGENYVTLEDVIVPDIEFEEYKMYRRSCYINISRSMLANIENENEGIINSLQMSDSILNGELFMGATHYSGTDSGAYGYGGIGNRTTYLKARYGGTPTVADSGKSLPVGKKQCTN